MKTIFLLLLFSMLYLIVLLFVWYMTGDEDIHYFNSYLSTIKLIDTGKTALAKALLLPKFYLLTFFTLPIIIMSYLSIKHDKFVEKNYYSSIPEKSLRFEEKDLKAFCEDPYTVVLYDYFTGEEKYRDSSTSLLSAITTCEHWIENLEVANDLYYASPDESIVVTMKDKLLREFRTDRRGCPHYFGVSSVCNVYNNKYYN